MDTMHENFSKTKNILKKKWLPAAGGILGILLLIGGNLGFQKDSHAEDAYSVQYYTEVLEERIQNLCTSVQGVTNATVLLTLDCGSEFVYAQNTDTTSPSTGVWDYVIVSRGDSEEPIGVTEIYPKVRGVAVVCTGGNSAAIQQVITELLTASLGISSNRIKVAGM